MLNQDFLISLDSQLRQLPRDQQLTFLKNELNKISDPEHRKIAETFLSLTLHAAFNSTKSHIVVLIHGIRTQASWQVLVEKELESAGITKVHKIKYGYIDAFCFWFPFFFRNKPIKIIKKQLRGIRARKENADISVIAHSFGTYIIARILKECTDIRLFRLILCGSIIPLSYDWDSIPNYPNGENEGIINEVGSHDYWPVLAETTTWGYGSSGRFGFGSHLVTDRFHNLDHSGFFRAEIVKKYWIPFLVKGTIVKSKHVPSTPPYWASALPYIKYLAGTSVLGMVGLILINSVRSL